MLSLPALVHRLLGTHLNTRHAPSHTLVQARRAPLPPRRRHHLLPAAAAAADAEQQHQQQPQTSTSRRGLLTAGGLLLAGAATGAPPAACADDAGSGTAVEGEGLVPYANPAQAYTLLRPAGWEQVCCAGLATPGLAAQHPVAPAHGMGG